jgi:hypothetical protein
MRLRAVPRKGRTVTEWKVAVAGALIVLAGARPALPQDDRASRVIDTLLATYPQALAGHDGNALVWRDGTKMPVADGTRGKSFSEHLRHPSIADQFLIPYPRGPLDKPPAVGADPGRFRNAAFFAKMYGDCRKAEVASRLVPVSWLAKTWGKSIRITSVNAVNERLNAVSKEIDALPETVKRAAYPIAGTYNCRLVADTGQRSSHSYGIAIDLNTAFADYWFWGPHAGKISYRNRMPREIVAIFEKHGFIWGGKWYHYDTMHFEYRPELLRELGR